MQKMLSKISANKAYSLALWIGASFLLYGNTLMHEFVLDDGLMILNNEFVKQGFSGIPHIFQHSHTFGTTGVEDSVYRPLTVSVFAMLWDLGGGKPFLFHLFNVLLYGLAGGMLFQFLRTSFGRFSETAIWLVTGVFMVHPLHTEVVANAKELEDILQFGFSIATLWTLNIHLQERKKTPLLLSLLLFTLSMLSKEIAFVFIGIIPIYLWVFSNEKLLRIAGISGLYALLAVGMLLFRTIVTGGAETTELVALNNALAASSDGMQQLATALWMQVKYLMLFLFPKTLSYDYSFNQIPLVDIASIRFIISVLVGAVLIGFCGYGIWKRRIFGFGLSFYLLSMVPVANVFFLIGSTMAERFMFTPLAGLSMALIPVLETWVPKHRRSWFVYGMVAVMVIFSLRTINRNKDWKSDEVLFRADVKSAPNSTRVHMGLGINLLHRSGAASNPQVGGQMLQEARTHLKRSVEILPENYEALYNLGVVLQRMGLVDQAMVRFRQCVQAAPEHALAHNNIGVILFNRKEYDAAEKAFNLAYRVNQKNADIVTNMGLAEYQKGNYRDALKYLEPALKINPAQPNALNLKRLCLKKLEEG